MGNSFVYKQSDIGQADVYATIRSYLKAGNIFEHICSAEEMYILFLSNYFCWFLINFVGSAFHERNIYNRGVKLKVQGQAASFYSHDEIEFHTPDIESKHLILSIQIHLDVTIPNKMSKCLHYYATGLFFADKNLNFCVS